MTQICMCHFFCVPSTNSPLFLTGAPSNLRSHLAVHIASNHYYFFHARAFIIRQNNPIYASTIGLFFLNNKKEKSFF